jgi:hypothetical protein
MQNAELESSTNKITEHAEYESESDTCNHGHEWKLTIISEVFRTL